MRTKYDIIIVGLGVAGIHFSNVCLKKGLKVLHIHKSIKGESTPYAAGLINPITGRRYVKSWMIDEVMPFALETYRTLEKELSIEVLKRLDIIRTLKDPGDENTWLSKTADPYLAQYMSDCILEGEFHQGLKPEALLGQLNGCYRIDVIDFQKAYIDKVTKDNSLVESKFEYDDLEIEEDRIIYKEYEADRILFAEGWKVLDNPWFQVPAFSPAKGELLIIHAPDLKLDKAYKKEQFITPMGQDRYWVGATYEWQNFDPNPTEKMKDRIHAKLEEVIQVPYKIEHHWAGIRPASKNRKPVMGTHPIHNNVHILNGMGTKGTSLAPYFSKLLYHHIYQDSSIMEEVNVQRYFSHK